MTSGIIGREAQLLEVERFLDAASAGFAVLVFEGDAGIGYTTAGGDGSWTAHRA